MANQTVATKCKLCNKELTVYGQEECGHCDCDSSKGWVRCLDCGSASVKFVSSGQGRSLNYKCECGHRFAVLQRSAC